ncbi:Cytochrome oxidase assembly [Exophiala xenobiotica]|uniref:Cytochrome c oxidase assembly protein COX16, mitochondrial n=1 Tax=Lithohypha guttulata TaxID=1690604 RepID=A0ABR0K6I4_9EURO|nr:Cytochrome oxidase assembly [Lithohypha guttulata]KAK5314651.1 Cytochrome oxidase assembly [Exophiala xenobiotica]
MPTFGSKPFKGSNASGEGWEERVTNFYRRQVTKRPFIMFGLPFISIMVAASFLLTPATALRYERHDRKHREVSQHEALELGLKGGATGEGPLTYNPRRRVIEKGGTTQRDEYYRLMAKDLDSWEQKRVERWKGEPDGRL